MNPEAVDTAGLRESLDAIWQELRRLGDRVAALEAAAGLQPGVRSRESGVKQDGPAAAPPPPTPDARPAAADAAGISEELLVVLGAAVAAFLGKRPHIKQIRLLGTTVWAQQGRVQIQASHALSARHPRSPH